MSITKDFENKITGIETYMGDNKDAYYADDVAELLAHTRALEGMLKKLQKATTAESADPDDPFSLTFVCRFGMGYQEEIAKLLEGVE